MRTKTLTIPSEFVPFDTNVTAADSYINVRDLQRFRLNHNSLLAQRVRKSLSTQIYNKDSDAPATQHNDPYIFRSRLNVTENAGPMILGGPIYVTQHTKQLIFYMRARKTELDGGSAEAADPKLFFVVRNPGTSKNVTLTSSFSVTTAHATAGGASYFATVNLPPIEPSKLFYGRQLLDFGVYIQCVTDSTQNIVGASAFTSVGENMFEGASATFGTGMVDTLVWVTTDLSIEARQIVKEANIGGGTYRYFLDSPWSRMPSPNSDTLAIREILGVEIFSFCIQENIITDFSAAQDY